MLAGKMDYNREKIDIILNLEELMPKQVNIKLDDEFYELLRVKSENNNKSVQAAAREMLLDMLAKYQEKLPDNKGKFTFIDLFAGIGGMRIAFEQQKGVCVFSSEWDEYAKKTYFANFGVLPQGDITQIASDDVPNHDILVAGFPCQPFSIAGVSKKNSLGKATGFQDKTQGTLFFDVCRIIEAKRPKAFLLENVKNLKSHDKGNTWRVIQESLEQLDYKIFVQVIDGQGFVPQHRERIFIVGFDKKRYMGDDIQFNFNLKKPDKAPVLSDILDQEVPDKYTLTDKLWEYLQNYAKKHKAKGNGFGYCLFNDDSEYTSTISRRYYKDGSEILIEQKGKNPRKLTPREAASLQGFPKEFKIPESNVRAYQQFGNSVAVPVVTKISEQIVEQILEV